MIYKTSTFKKELRQAYSEDKLGINRKMAFSLFLGLFSFAVFFVLQTLRKSVLSDAVPVIMQTSFFSTVYIYIHLALVFNALYFMVYYDALFFSEIRKNAWYQLIKLGYRPAPMIAMKLLALLSSVLLVYTVGFVSIVLMTVFLKYTFIFAYLPALYLVGLVDLVLVGMLSMALSLFVRTAVNARYLIGASALGILILKWALGFYSVASNRVAMQDIHNVFDPGRSPFMLAAGLIFIAAGIVCTLRASRLALYYMPDEDEWADQPDGARLVRLDTEDSNPKTLRPRWDKKIFNAVFSVLLIVFISLALVFNVLVILLSTSTPGNEVTIRGVIPYIFQSDTMQPDIQMNDLAYFQRVDSQYPVKTGDIVLLRQDNIVYVERVIGIDGSAYTVDINNYPAMSEKGAMIKTVPREDIYGIYSGRNRWLGALILFSNTIIGRIVFLIVPAVLLFYRSVLMKSVKRLSGKTSNK